MERLLTIPMSNEHDFYFTVHIRAFEALGNKKNCSLFKHIVKHVNAVLNALCPFTQHPIAPS